MSFSLCTHIKVKFWSPIAKSEKTFCGVKPLQKLILAVIYRQKKKEKNCLETKTCCFIMQRLKFKTKNNTVTIILTITK